MTQKRYVKCIGKRERRAWNWGQHVEVGKEYLFEHLDKDYPSTVMTIRFVDGINKGCILHVDIDQFSNVPVKFDPESILSRAESYYEALDFITDEMENCEDDDRMNKLLDDINAILDG